MGLFISLKINYLLIIRKHVTQPLALVLRIVI